MLFNDVVTIYAAPTSNDYGESSWGANDSYKARFVEKTTKTVSPTGEMILADAIVYLPDAAKDIVALGRRVVYSSTNYEIVELKKVKDTSGTIRYVRCILKLTAI